MSLNEQELRTAVHDALKAFQRAAKITLEERQEKTIGTGRADSVYSHVLIEYERPGKLKDKNTSLETGTTTGHRSYLRPGDRSYDTELRRAIVVPLSRAAFLGAGKSSYLRPGDRGYDDAPELPLN